MDNLPWYGEFAVILMESSVVLGSEGWFKTWAALKMQLVKLVFRRPVKKILRKSLSGVSMSVCCIFRPAIRCCALQTLVEIDCFIPPKMSFFSLKTRFYLWNVSRPAFCFFKVFCSKKWVYWDSVFRMKSNFWLKKTTQACRGYEIYRNDFTSTQLKIMRLPC